VNGKYLFLSMDTRVCIENYNVKYFEKILKCNYNILKKNISFLSKSLFIFLLQLHKNAVCDMGLNVTFSKS